MLLEALFRHNSDQTVGHKNRKACVCAIIVFFMSSVDFRQVPVQIPVTHPFILFLVKLKVCNSYFTVTVNLKTLSALVSSAVFATLQVKQLGSFPMCFQNLSSYLHICSIIARRYKGDNLPIFGSL